MAMHTPHPGEFITINSVGTGRSLKQEGWLCVHIEVQGDVDLGFERRMFVYEDRGLDTRTLGERFTER